MNHQMGKMVIMKLEKIITKLKKEQDNNFKLF